MTFGAPSRPPPEEARADRLRGELDLRRRGRVLLRHPLLPLAILAPVVVLQSPGRREHLSAVGAGVLSGLVHVEDVSLDAALGQVDLLAVGAGVACKRNESNVNGVPRWSIEDLKGFSELLSWVNIK